MTISIDHAREILEKRNQAFINADLEGYMEFWSQDGVMELDGVQIAGWSKMKEAIERAWSISKVLHFETRAFSANGNSVLNEFAIVWQNKSTSEIALQTGMGVIDLNESGKWVYLRDYFDASGNNFLDSSSSQRKSAFDSEKVSRHFSENA